MDSLFSENFLQEFILHAAFSEHIFQPPILVLSGPQLGYHRSIRTAIIRPPFLKRGTDDRLLAAQLCHRYPAFSLTRNAHNLHVP